MVAAADAARARELLADLPGSTLVLADATTATTALCPRAPPRTCRWMASWPAWPGARRPGRGHRHRGRVWVAGGFASPLTGHAARADQARERMNAAADRLGQAEEAVQHARSQVAVARGRVSAASAAERAARLQQDIAGLRTAWVTWPPSGPPRAEVRAARQEHAEMLAAVQTRTQQADRLGPTPACWKTCSSATPSAAPT